MKKKVLHITPWFPSEEKPYEAIWIKRHIESLEPHFNQDILHLQVIDGPFKYTHQINGNLRKVILRTPITSWRIKEFFTLTLLCSILPVYYRNGSYSLCNFHIAYPNLLAYRILKRIMEVPFLITEHWSFYHFNFFSTKKLSRIKAIFKYGIPLITVSSSLKKDISTFCNEEIPAQVIPNVVDTSVFIAQNNSRGEHYLMTAFWKEPKKPFAVLEAVRSLKDGGNNVSLRVGGYGPLWEEMQEYCNEHNLNDVVRFLGKLTPDELATEMNECKAFLLPSDYETFSVVCAEALCCGSAVIASDVGALSELVDRSNGKLVSDNWVEALTNSSEYNSEHISAAAKEKFSKESVGMQYSELIKKLIID